MEKWFDLREISRDLMALGSIPFLLLVLIRIYIANNYLQFFQIIFGVILIFLLSIIFKRNDKYSAVIVVLGVFTSIFYNELKFTIFAVIIGLLALFGMHKYLGRRHVWHGSIFGGISSLISYFISIYLPLRNY